MYRFLISLVGIALGGALAACAQGNGEMAQSKPFRPSYLGVETRVLDSELINLIVRMRGARSGDDVAAYAECVVAQYALARGYGFARHVRTNVTEESGVWRADAVYTISPALPRGVQQIDAEVVVEHCASEGIPTV